MPTGISNRPTRQRALGREKCRAEPAREREHEHGAQPPRAPAASQHEGEALHKRHSRRFGMPHAFITTVVFQSTLTVPARHSRVSQPRCTCAAVGHHHGPPTVTKRTSPPQSEASPVAHVGPGASLKPGAPGSDGTKTWPRGCESGRDHEHRSSRPRAHRTAALPRPCRGAGGGSRSPGSPGDKALGKSDVPLCSGCAVPALQARF